VPRDRSASFALAPLEVEEPAASLDEAGGSAVGAPRSRGRPDLGASLALDLCRGALSLLPHLTPPIARERRGRTVPGAYRAFERRPGRQGEAVCLNEGGDPSACVRGGRWGPPRRRSRPQPMIGIGPGPQTEIRPEHQRKGSFAKDPAFAFSPILRVWIHYEGMVSGKTPLTSAQGEVSPRHCMARVPGDSCI
jgi:hypothetical protein